MAFLLAAACITIGYVASYWNVAFYPEWCSNVELDDTDIYNTAVRVSGAWAGIAHALKQVCLPLEPHLCFSIAYSKYVCE